MNISPFGAGTQKIHLLDSLVAGDFWEMTSTVKCDERHRDRGRPWILEREQVPHFSSLGSRVLFINMRPSWILVLVSPNLPLKEMGLDLVEMISMIPSAFKLFDYLQQ